VAAVEAVAVETVAAWRVTAGPVGADDALAGVFGTGITGTGTATGAIEMSETMAETIAGSSLFWSFFAAGTGAAGTAAAEAEGVAVTGTVATAIAPACAAGAAVTGTVRAPLALRGLSFPAPCLPGRNEVKLGCSPSPGVPFWETPAIGEMPAADWPSPAPAAAALGCGAGADGMEVI
jgi:hypothetical protein